MTYFSDNLGRPLSQPAVTIPPKTSGALSWTLFFSLRLPKHSHTAFDKLEIIWMSEADKKKKAPFCVLFVSLDDTSFTFNTYALTAQLQFFINNCLSSVCLEEERNLGPFNILYKIEHRERACSTKAGTFSSQSFVFVCLFFVGSFFFNSYHQTRTKSISTHLAGNSCSVFIPHPQASDLPWSLRWQFAKFHEDGIHKWPH